jgi:Protein of unknown function (DUF4199)
MIMKNYTTEIKFSLILTLLTITWTAAEKLLGFHDEHIALHPFISMLILIPLIYIYYCCLTEKKHKHYHNLMSYWQGLMTSIRFSAITALLAPLSQVLISKVITPSYFQNAIAYSVKHNFMSQVDAEAHFNLNSYIVQSVMGCLLMGCLIGLVLAAVCKTRKKTAN